MNDKRYSFRFQDIKNRLEQEKENQQDRSGRGRGRTEDFRTFTEEHAEAAESCPRKMKTASGIS